MAARLWRARRNVWGGLCSCPLHTCLPLPLLVRTSWWPLGLSREHLGPLGTRLGPSWGPLGGLLGCLRGIPCRHGPFLIGVRGGRAAKASGRQRGYLQECACTQQRSIAIMGISISLSSETSQSLNGGTVYSPPGAWVASLPASTATTMLSVQRWFGSSPRVARGAPLTTSLERGRR